MKKLKNIDDLIGEKFNYLTVIKDLGMLKRTSRNKRYIKCQCDCGSYINIRLDSIGITKDCGCKIGNTMEIPIGKKFDRLTIIKDLGMKFPKEDSTKKARYVKCDCDCGNICVVQYGNLRSGNIRSCGCLASEVSSKNAYEMSQKNLTHGDSTKKSEYYSLYIRWLGIKNRCYNDKHEKYKWYGGLGVEMCDEWINNYKTFKYWAINNGYSRDLTIDRIDVLGNYESSNCQWITMEDNIIKEYTIDRKRKESIK